MSLTKSSSEYLDDVTFQSKNTFFRKLLIRQPGVAWFCSKQRDNYPDRNQPNNLTNVNMLVPSPSSVYNYISKDDNNEDITHSISTPHIAIDQFCIGLEILEEFQRVIKYEFGIPLVLTYCCKTQELDTSMHLLVNDKVTYYDTPRSDIILYDKTIPLTTDQLVTINQSSPSRQSGDNFVVLTDSNPFSSMMFYTYPYRRLTINPLDNQSVTINAFLKTNSKVSSDKYSYIDINKYVSVCNISVLLCSDDYKSEITSL